MKDSSSSLADALFSKGQQRVIGRLFALDAEHSVNELVRLSGGGWGGVEREVARLVAAGILSERRLGNQRRVRANPDSPVYPELRALADKLLGTPVILRRVLATFGPRIRSAFIYGSYAKGTDRSSSDIDLLVVGDCDYSALAGKIAGAGKRIGRAVSVRLYAPREFDALLASRDPFIASVMRGPRIEIQGQGGELPALARTSSRKRK